MKLLVSPTSPFARKVRVLIREAGAAGMAAGIEEVVVDTTPLRTDPSVAGANPLGRIPALIRDDGPALFDSRVIACFLDDRLGAGLYPAPRLWEVLTLEALADGLAEAALAMAYERRLRPEGMRWEPWVEAQWAKVARGLDALEDRWMSHLAGPPHMGQVGVGCALGYLDVRHADRAWREGRPALAAWEARFALRPAMATTRPG